ncbi:hypothetical protein AYO41_00630 [Verrucomicrobia bacterium SCGC AG-212-E04]|nr:hypothetical protein AYO41_00630 [Verrucomicrobia bacterium SCGC AG-212-E04]
MGYAIVSQLLLVVYHQVTTLVDLFPFNGARNYASRKRFTEAGVNAVLMCLGPIGFAFRIHGLMLFGVCYYFALFAAELIIWWIPYLTVPAGRWRAIYNRLLSLATSNFEPGDTLDHWIRIHDRLHRGTLTFLPARAGRVVPNLEHTLLHVLTLVTAIITLVAYRSA